MKKLMLFLFVGLLATSHARQPNVLFIVVDDLGWKDTGCYGSSFYETPNVDRLAATGMRFTDAYSANPLCCPTRSSIMTGQYPVRTGFTSASGHIAGEHKHAEAHSASPDQRAAGPSSINYLPLEYYTLGEAFKDAGYATAFLGKWHMGHDPYIPENHGFDFVVGGREHPGPPGLDGNRKFFPPWDKKITLPANPPADKHIDDYLGDRAVEYIRENKNKPFFMCFWLYDVHAPFQSKPELVEKWKKKADPANPQHSPTMAAMVEVMDDNVGRVLDALEKNGMADDTIVIFTSDNGGNMYDVADGTTPTNNEPLRSGKGNNYEGGVRIPLIVRWPGKTKPGTVNPSVISTVDHYPSLLEMTGQQQRPLDHKDGVSYVPALQGRAHDRGPTLCDFTHFVPATMNVPNTWIREGDWKLLRFWFDGAGQEHRYELYNMKDDIGETKNLASAYPEKVQTMAAALDRYFKNSGSLKANRNEAYNGKTVGVWSAKGNGTIAAQDGALVLEAGQPQFDARTRVTPSLVSEAWLEFEARSAKGNIVSVQWTSHGAPDFGVPERNVAKALSNEWKPFRVKMDFPSRIKDVRFVLSNEGDVVELRNVKLLTPDGSVITEYEFY
ncbi:Arylsulfatase [Pontiella desulfatans]|uniref:Arylsulfatase n=1 Tax=Pontiella desulfatans TaxID=2750659 RepID=A0A6C2TVG0_PONDE|nr:sulfatase [Pontiella desulfatans]SPS73594.1 sulfatase S1_16 [Kiritimatiellales bacterium]VGO11464.1 Arylsulfatase [Pontiella desulfatans]